MMKCPQNQQTKAEPWAISPSGEVLRVVIHRANLNPRQERFVLEYLKDGNGTRAAIRAGYATSSAAVHAHRLLKNERVLDKVRACQNRFQQRTEVTVEKTLRELAAVAFFDPRLLFDRKGKLLPPGKMPKDALSAIDFDIQESAKGRKVRMVRWKTAGKMAALTALGTYLGLFPKHVVTSPDGHESCKHRAPIGQAVNNRKLLA